MTPIKSGNPWNAVWVMMVGVFMNMLDANAVLIANPTMMTKLETDYDTVIWTTSVYLLAFAVPLLLAGRLGDQFGPKNLYLIGLTVFTAASLWCGLSDTIDMLIFARGVQGLGAGLLAPQITSVITRVFSVERRGAAMGVVAATSALATLVGPLVGGVLVDAVGWEWIFLVNIPIGVVGLALAVRLVPVLPNHTHRFDLIGVGLSGVGMFLIVFALQEGQPAGWAAWVWTMIAAGVGFMSLFCYWQSVNTREPLLPLGIFRDRNFAICNLATVVLFFAMMAMPAPTIFYAQMVCGLSPSRSALLYAMTSIVPVLLAPIVGKIVDRSYSRPVLVVGFGVLAVALLWLSIEMTPATPIWRLLLPLTALDIAVAFLVGPLAATATRNLPTHLAGAGSGVYSLTRALGAMLGSAAMAAFMTSRIAYLVTPMSSGVHPPTADATKGTALRLPEFLREPFSIAMSQSLLLPAFIALVGVVVALFTVGDNRFGAGQVNGIVKLLDD